MKLRPRNNFFPRACPIPTPNRKGGGRERSAGPVEFPQAALVGKSTLVLVDGPPHMYFETVCGFLAEARSKDGSFLGLLIDAR